MSRSGYTDDCDNDWEFIMYRGRVASATRGKRGQALLREMLIAFNAMPVKRLIADELETHEGDVCALGAAARTRGLPLADLDPDDSETVAGRLNIAECLAREIVFMNDEAGWRETPEERFIRVRKWVRSQITDPLFDVVWC